MPKIVDPDNLTSGTSVFWTTGSISTRTIGVSSSLDSPGSLVPPLESGSDSGVTLQTLYSFAKEEWKNTDTLIRIPFPFVSITKNQFDIINFWDFESDASRFLIRDAGWSVISGSTTVQEWVGIRTLGNIELDSTTIPPTSTLSDQVYYVQSGSEVNAVALTLQDFKMSGSANQAILQYSASSATTERNFRGSTQLYVREYKKIYDDADVQADLGVTNQEYTLLSVPLQNSVDLKINTDTEAQAATEGPWAFTDIYFFTGSGFVQSGSVASPYVAGLVVSSSTDGQWYINNTAGADAGPAPGGNWSPYAHLTAEATALSGSQQIRGATAGDYSVFNVIITNGTGSAAETGSVQDVYTSVQYQLRQATDIDKCDHFTAGTFIGKRTRLLLSFVGDTLVTSNGVYVANQQDADTNSIDFYDVSGSVVRYPFVSTGTLTFNDNITSDFSASYFMFFTDLTTGGQGGTGTFGTPDAVIVEDNDSLLITGSLRDNAGPVTSSVSFTFDYDGNVQGGRASVDAPVTVVAIGFESAAYVTVSSTIVQSKTNNISLVAALERNYDNPA